MMVQTRSVLPENGEVPFLTHDIMKFVLRPVRFFFEEASGLVF